MASKSLREEAGSQVPVVAQSQAVALDDMPDFLREVTTQHGAEEITSDKMKIPRLAIAQDGSEQRKSTNANYIKGLEPGMLFNSLTGDLYDRPLLFIPIFFYTSRIMFKPLTEGGGILCQAPDGVHCQLNEGGPCLHSAWGKSGEKPPCTEFYNFGVALPQHNMEEMVLSLKSTGLDAARTLNSLIRKRKKDSYAGVYALDTLHKVDGKMDWWEPLITNAGWATKEQWEACGKLYHDLFGALKSGKITFDAEVSEPGAHSGDEM